MTSVVSLDEEWQQELASKFQEASRLEKREEQVKKQVETFMSSLSQRKELERAREKEEQLRSRAREMEDEKVKFFEEERRRMADTLRVAQLAIAATYRDRDREREREREQQELEAQVRYRKRANVEGGIHFRPSSRLGSDSGASEWSDGEILQSPTVASASRAVVGVSYGDRSAVGGHRAALPYSPGSVAAGTAVTVAADDIRAGVSSAGEDWLASPSRVSAGAGAGVTGGSAITLAGRPPVAPLGRGFSVRGMVTDAAQTPLSAYGLTLAAAVTPNSLARASLDAYVPGANAGDVAALGAGILSERQQRFPPLLVSQSAENFLTAPFGVGGSEPSGFSSPQLAIHPQGAGAAFLATAEATPPAPQSVSRVVSHQALFTGGSPAERRVATVTATSLAPLVIAVTPTGPTVSFAPHSIGQSPLVIAPNSSSKASTPVPGAIPTTADSVERSPSAALGSTKSEVTPSVELASSLFPKRTLVPVPSAQPRSESRTAAAEISPSEIKTDVRHTSLSAPSSGKPTAASASPQSSVSSSFAAAQVSPTAVDTSTAAAATIVPPVGTAPFASVRLMSVGSSFSAEARGGTAAQMTGLGGGGQREAEEMENREREERERLDREQAERETVAERERARQKIKEQRRLEREIRDKRREKGNNNEKCHVALTVFFFSSFFFLIRVYPLRYRQENCG